MARWAHSDPLFWTLWGIELAVMLWWLFDDMRQTYIPVNPMVYVGFIWLFAALFTRQVLGWRVLAFILVGIPALPLSLMAVFMLVILLVSIFDGPIRWN